MAIAATGPVSLAAGQRVAAEGGNAVDAAIAAAIAAMSTEPGIVSLGGGAFVSIWGPDAPPVVLDGNVEMPGRGLPRSAFGGGVTEVNTDYGGGVRLYAGHGSVATPGALRVCQAAVEGYGQATWQGVVEPSAHVCRDGYPVGGAAARYLGFTAHSLFGLADEAHALVTRPDGTPVQAGDIATNPLLADTLDLIAAEGSSVTTIGQVGRALVADMAAHGGLITSADLAAYEPVVRTPVRRTIGDWDVAINPPPSVGGPMLAVMLSQLGQHEDWSWTEIIDIQRQVLSYRLAVHDFSRDLEGDGHALLEEVERYGMQGLPTSASTANISVVDSDGLACAITMSSGYGAGITIPGTGIILNNALGEPELNRLGLHAVAPGTRLASNMAPTTGRTEDGRVLAAGSPGADRITTALMQVLAQGCLKDADLAEAINAPRLHVRFEEDTTPVVEHEADPQIAAAVEALGLRGHDHGELSMYFGGVGAAYRSVAGELVAAGDARREAAVGVR